MKLAFSTNAYTRHSLVDALRGIRRAGFAGVEILADEPHAYPPKIDANLTDTVRRVLDETGLAVSNINGNCSFGYWRGAPPGPDFEPSLISPNPKHRADRSAMILRTLEFAKAVGARNISITSGRLLGGMPPTKAEAQFAESIRPILDRAEQLEVNVGIECEPGLYLEYIAAARLGGPPRVQALRGEPRRGPQRRRRRGRGRGGRDDARPHLEPPRRRPPRPQALPHDPWLGDVRLADTEIRVSRHRL